MKQTIPHGDTHDTREGTALHEAIGAANYWHKKAQNQFWTGVSAGIVVTAVVAIVGGTVIPATLSAGRGSTPDGLLPRLCK